MDDDFFDYLGISRNAVKSIAIFLIILGIVCIPSSMVIESYNGLVDSDLVCQQARSNVQTSLEMRADLIPNIVSTISGSSSFEKSTLIDVVSERSKAFQLKSDVSSSSTTDQLSASESNIDSTISRLLLIAEQYPTLKSTDQYLALQTQLSNTETTIRLSRNDYNHAVKNYQSMTRSFPTNIFAVMFGFSTDKWKSFEVYDNKGDVPVVKFTI